MNIADAKTALAAHPAVFVHVDGFVERLQALHGVVRSAKAGHVPAINALVAAGLTCVEIQLINTPADVIVALANASTARVSAKIAAQGCEGCEKCEGGV